MIDMETSIVINRPVEEVFEYVTTAEKIPEWAPSVIEARQIPPGPTAVGTRIVQTVKVPLSKTEATWEVIAFEPNSLCRFRADSSYFTGEVTFMVEVAEGGTKFTSHDKGSPRGLLRLLEPLLYRSYRNGRKQYLATIKQNLES